MAAAPVGPVGVHQAAGLAELHARAFEAAWSAQAIAELLASPFVFALAAPPDSPRSFVLLRAVAGEAEILTLAVDPAARRRGLGLSLTEAAVALARSVGAETLWLEVAADNAGALALYSAAGFLPSGRRPAYYARSGGAVDAVVMRRALNSVTA